MLSVKKHWKWCLLALLLTSVSGGGMTWDEAMDAISEKRRALSAEEQTIQEQLKTIEAQVKIQDEHIALLNGQLAALSGSATATQPMPNATENKVASASTAPSLNHQPREDQLIAQSLQKILVIEGKAGKPSGAFLAPHDGKILLFASAHWLDENPRPTVTQQSKSPLALGEELTCPAGVDLVCLHPAANDLPHFEWAEPAEKPAVGARVVVISLDPSTKLPRGIGGSIRGIGPDTMELDAELTPEMTGAPVLSLDSGKIIGIVAPQIAGVQDEWAIGTRHEGSRNFATRIDRIQEWKPSDLGRYAKEAAYIQAINQRTRIAWLAHMLVVGRTHTQEKSRKYFEDSSAQRRPQQRDGESSEEFIQRRKREAEESYKKVEEERKESLRLGKIFREIKAEALKHADNPHIARVNSWIKDSWDAHDATKRADEKIRLANIYRTMLADISKQEPDLSAHMTPYHLQQYRAAKEIRSQGIRIIGQNADRVGQ
ncbi:MAG: hypothetical protein ACRCXD_13660 [Luteolibacter sp.]